jgi:hypothetical protein
MKSALEKCHQQHIPNERDETVAQIEMQETPMNIGSYDRPIPPGKVLMPDEIVQKRRFDRYNRGEQIVHPDFRQPGQDEHLHADADRSDQ